MITFCLTTFAWIFFRSEDIKHAFEFIADLFTGFTVKSGYVNFINFLYWELDLFIPITVSVFFLIEWLGRREKYGLEKFGLNWKKPFRYLVYYVLVYFIITLSGKEQQFIYFQF